MVCQSDQLVASSGPLLLLLLWPRLYPAPAGAPTMPRSSESTLTPPPPPRERPRRLRLSRRRPSLTALIAPLAPFRLALRGPLALCREPPLEERTRRVPVRKLAPKAEPSPPSEDIADGRAGNATVCFSEGSSLGVTTWDGMGWDGMENAQGGQRLPWSEEGALQGTITCQTSRPAVISGKTYAKPLFFEKQYTGRARENRVETQGRGVWLCDSANRFLVTCSGAV